MTLLFQNSWDYWSSGGLLLLPLALVSVGIWGHFLRSRDRMKQVIEEQHALEQNFQSLETFTPLEGKPIHAFLQLVREDIASGAPPRDSFHKREAECMEGLRRELFILAALTAVAPLLGLLGTVNGMIDTFGAVAEVAGNTGTEVAGGISQALITTQFGLLIALPGVFSISRLKSLLSESQKCMGSLRAQVLAHVEMQPVESSS